MKLPKSSTGLGLTLLVNGNPIVLSCAPWMLCSNAAHKHWADTKIVAIVVVMNATVIIVVAIAIAPNVSFQNKCFEQKTV